MTTSQPPEPCACDRTLHNDKATCKTFRRLPTPPPATVNYSQYICRGAHCKCMNLDGTCQNFHNGDHTCPTSQRPATGEARTNKPASQEPEVQISANSGKRAAKSDEQLMREYLEETGQEADFANITALRVLDSLAEPETTGNPGKTETLAEGADPLSDRIDALLAPLMEAGNFTQNAQGEYDQWIFLDAKSQILALVREAEIAMFNDIWEAGYGEDIDLNFSPEQQATIAATRIARKLNNLRKELIDHA